jgi:hypothetical protein
VIRAVLEGRRGDRWSDQYNRRFVARRRLVKDVWSNLRLGWMARAVPEATYLLVLRHPCATVLSQMRSGWEWHVSPEVFLDQPALVEGPLAAHLDLVRGARPGLEQHVVAWCVDMLVALGEIGGSAVHVAFYEHLVTRPAEELGALFAAAGRELAAAALARAGTPSALTRVGTPGQDPVARWTSAMPRRDAERAIELVEAFGLGGLYGLDPMPVPRDGRSAPGLVRSS